MILELHVADVVDDHKIKMDAMRLKIRKIRKYAIHTEAWYHYAVGSIVTLVAIMIAFVFAFVTPWIRCVRCLSVIRRSFHVICLRVAFYHVIMCILFRIRVRLMHPSIFPVVRFAIRHSYIPRRPLVPLFVCGC